MVFVSTLDFSSFLTSFSLQATASSSELEGSGLCRKPSKRTTTKTMVLDSPVSSRSHMDVELIGNTDRPRNDRPVTTSRTRRGLRSQVEEEQQAAFDTRAASITSFSRDVLAQENRRLLEENEYLRKVEERLMQENAKLREDGRKMRAESRDHKRQSRIDKAEIDRLRECYRVTMEEKVSIAERLAVSDLDTISTIQADSS